MKRLEEIVDHLLGEPLDVLEPLDGGGNSRVYRARAGGASYLVKCYPRNDARPRLVTEERALLALTAVGAAVPGVVASAPEEHVAIHEWIEGRPVSDPGDADIDALVTLVEQAQTIEEPEAFGPAAAACLSMASAMAQVESRLQAAQTIEEPEAAAFVAGQLAPAARRVLERLSRRADEIGLDLDAELEGSEAILSPSDLGFHNSIRRPDGSLVFCDFEYFGRDDPAKLLADVSAHPGMSLVRGRMQRLVAGLRPLLSDERRLHLGLPLWRLCWCMIVLNAFLPDRPGLVDDEGRRARLADAIARLPDVETPWQLWTPAP